MEKSFKYTSLEVAYLLLVILFLARPATLFNNIDPRMNLVGFIIYTIPCLYLAYKYEVRLDKKFLYLLGGYTAWVGVHYFIDYDFKLLSFLLIYIHIFVAYVLVRVFHSELFGYFWRLVTGLTIIDCILWAGIHFVDLSFLEQISPLTPTSDTSSASFLIFNTPGVRYEGLGILGLLRNCGFAWEPGLYGSILILATFFNLAEYEYKVHNNKPLYILLFGLFTTFSTTAYTGLLVLFAVRSLLILRLGMTFKRLVGVTSLVGAVLLINQLPFMNEKILDDTNMENTLSGNKDNLKWVQKEQATRTVKRTEGLVLDYYNFTNSPTFGYGIDPTNSFVSRNISPYLQTSNDLTSFLAKWGIIYTVLLLILFIWNSVFMRHYVLLDYNSFFILFLVVAVSYCISLCALTMCFLLYRVLEDEEEIDYLTSYASEEYTEEHEQE